MSYNLDLIGIYREPETYITLVTGVEVGGTPATTPAGDATDWERLPSEEVSSLKLNVEKLEVSDISGATAKKISKLKNITYESKLNQRDKDTMNLVSDLSSYVNQTCLLGMKGHNFGSGSQEWVFIFGTVEIDESSIDTKEGRPTFVFTSMNNPVAIIIGDTSGSAQIDEPDSYSFSSDLTIPANGHYVRDQI